MYGSDAYGPGGKLINTNDEFEVHQQFISTRDYKELFKLRTVFSQYG